MNNTFDPYRKWLGIAPRDQPPHHYRLLGIDPFESDPDVISHAADARMVHLKTFQAGKYSKLSQRILNEVATAKICLLNSEKKSEYDGALRARLQADVKPVPKAVPVAPPSAVSQAVERPAIQTGIPRVEAATVTSYAAARKKQSPRQLAAVVGVAGLALVALLIFLATSDGDKPIARRPKSPVSESENRSPDETSQERSDLPKPDAKPTEPELEGRNKEPPPVDMRPPEEPTGEPTEPEPPEEPTEEPVKKPDEPEPDQPSTDEPARPKRLAVPDEAARRVAEARVRGVFKEEFSTAKDRQQKLALAEKLFSQAKETEDDPAARFVMFQLACQLAAESGELTSTLSAVDRIGQQYDIDSLQMKGDLLAKAVEATRGTRQTPAYNQNMVQSALGVIDEAVEMDDYEAADRLAKLAQPASRKTKDKRIIRQLVDRGREIKRLQQRFADIQKALDVLAKDPANREANLTVGKWYCFEKGLWDKGLPLLAKGSDPALAELAAKDLATKDAAGANDPKAQIELGNLWWERAENEEGASKGSMQSRAGHWYTQGLPALSGLARTEVEKRLQALEKEPSASKITRPSHYLLFDGQSSYVAIPSLRYDGAHSITLEGIVVPAISNRDMAVIANTDDAGVSLFLNPKECKAWWHTPTGWLTVTSDQPVSPNRRTHLAVAVDGQQIRLFVNGRQQQQVVAMPSGHKASPLPFFVGADPVGRRIRNCFKGIIEEVRISKSAKYQGDFTPPQHLTSEIDTLVLLRFYQGQGDTVRDESGNGHNGIIKNAQWVTRQQLGLGKP